MTKPITPSSRRRMAERLGCLPEEVEEKLRHHAKVTVDDICFSITKAVKTAKEELQSEIEAGATPSEEELKARLIAACELGWQAGRDTID